MNINEARLIEENRRLEKTSGYFRWMLDEYFGNAYVSDIETYELLYLNPAACETLKQPMKQLLGHKCYKVIQGLDAPCPFCTNRFLSEEDFYVWEFYNPVLESTFLIKNRLIDWDGHKARLELSHDNHSMEYKLAKKDKEREAIIRTIPGGLVRVDASDLRTILWHSNSFLQLIGYTKEQFENELNSQCNYIHPEDLARATALSENAVKTGRPVILEARILTRNQETRYLTITLSYVSREESWDGIASLYSVGIDVTKEREEHNRQRRALEDACQAARVASQAKTNFLSTMSHDIRTPMNAIMGMSAIALSNLDSPERLRDCISKISVSGQHLLRLLNEVLDMSKIESGKFNLNLSPVKLPELFRDIEDMCHPLIEEKHQELQISMKQIRHENVIADRERLQQILMNLMSNAIKYTGDGGTIFLELHELDSAAPNRGQYEFICADNGSGISSEFIPHIFEPFTRAEDSGISRLQGTGLGMAITENIVRMMNGTIGVESELGKGSRFTVSLSLELGQEERVFSETKEIHLAGKRLLLVEDNEINREIATELIQMQEIAVAAVENGQLALEAFEASAPGEYDAILMDIQMPVMDGFQATEAIRALNREDAQTVPILALTANVFAADMARARSVGMNDYIAKPIDAAYLLETIQKWIG